MDQYLFDTEVIIDYLRGNREAVNFFRSLEGDFHVSAITIAELWSGVKGEEEKAKLGYFLSLFDVLPISREIAIEGGMLRNRWHQSHGMGLADALIAATAISKGLTLISLNEKHYGMMEVLKVQGLIYIINPCTTC